MMVQIGPSACVPHSKRRRWRWHYKKNTFFQACCYIFLSCEVDNCEVDSSVNIYLSNGSCLIEMGARFYFEDGDFTIIFFHNHFSSERPEDIVLLETSASKICTTHCQTLGEVHGLFKSPFLMFEEIKFSIVYSIMMVKQYLEKAPRVLSDTSYGLKALVAT